MDNCLLSSRELWNRLEDSVQFIALMRPELDIVVYAANADDAAASSHKARRVFTRAAENNLHLALVDLPADLVRHYWPGLNGDEASITCLRSCLMKTEHLDWIDKIFSILVQSAK